MSSVLASKQFRPLLLAIFCWVTVFFVPATRQGFFVAWKNHQPGPYTPINQLPGDVAEPVAAPPFAKTTTKAASVLARFPHEKSVLMRAAEAAPGAAEQNWKILSDIFPNDGLLWRLQLMNLLQDLPSGRPVGPLSSANPAASPPKVKPLTPPEIAGWEKAIDLAKKGRRAQPNNTFFDWMLLFCLLCLNRDDEARQVLKQAASKTEFDVYTREDFQQRIRYLKLTQGESLDPADLFSAVSSWEFSSNSKIRAVSRSLMETVMADRAAGRHDRAITTATELLRLARVQRREGYSVIDSLVGSACESIVLLSAAPRRISGGIPMKLPKLGSPTQFYQVYSTSLFSYAKEQGHTKLLPKLDSEWKELGTWKNALRTLIPYGLQPYSLIDAGLLQVAERLRTLTLHSLPGVFLLGLACGLIPRRFERSQILPISSWRIGTVTCSLLFAALVLDLTMGVQINDPDSDAHIYAFIANSDLVMRAPSWIWFGIPAAMVCLAANILLFWRRKEEGRHVGLKQRIKTGFNAPEDELARFDFGWLVGLIARLSLWLLFSATLLIYCVNPNIAQSEHAWTVPTFWFSLVFGMNFVVWLKTPARRETLRRFPALVAGAMAGYFVVASVLYAVTAFAFLPLANRFQAQFEQSVQQGELQFARQKLKLK